MRSIFILFSLVFFANPFHAQEIPSSTKKPVFEKPMNSGLPSILLRETPKEDFKYKDGDPTKNKPIDIRSKDDLLTAGDFIENKWSEDKKAKEEFGEDQYLGDFKTKGDFVELYCRDYQYVDGDKVRVYVNGKMVKSSITLMANYTPILIDLESGFNTVEIEALNQGSSGPNTAAFKVFDVNGDIVTSNEWNLLTGAKASFIVLKN